MTIRTVWFESTGRHTDFDKDGISSVIYRNMETGEETSKLPVGALFWMKPNETGGAPAGYDGLRVYCVCPGDQQWCIDGRASNCTMPGDDAHRCWCRHGTIGERVTVDKVGNTCSAGAGSIQVDGWHGWLRDGNLVVS